MKFLTCQNMVNWGLRLSLSLAFLSAVADRLGIWGESGSDGVVWGNFDAFAEYTRSMNPWFPDIFITPIAYFVTILEVILGLLLFLPWKTREVAFISGALILIFGLAMSFAFGPKAAFDYSVFSAAFAGFALSKLSTDL